MTTLESRINIPQDVLFRDVDGEAVILNLATGKYFGLDQVGTRMWALLAQHKCVADCYRVLLDEYDVTAEQLQHDLLNLIDNLVSHQLIQIDETQT